MKLAKLLRIGLGGHTAEAPNCSTSGYITDADLAAADMSGKLAIGATVIDKIPALDRPGGAATSIRGPMCDVSLSAGKIRRFVPYRPQHTLWLTLTEPGDEASKISVLYICEGPYIPEDAQELCSRRLRSLSLYSN